MARCCQILVRLKLHTRASTAELGFTTCRYNGRRSTPPKLFPSRLEEACHYVEQTVNAEIKKRSRFSLEYAGVNDAGYNWSPNVAASNRYEGRDEGVGFHSDQLTYLGPYCTIASISLGRRFLFPNDGIST